tara:strand:+ start:7039 stop:8466 length:1428 start_codon:yes stop_codon:yes gene_type:complete
MSFFYPYENVNEYNNTIKFEYKNKTILNKEINDYNNKLNNILIPKSTPINGDIIKHKESYYKIDYFSKEPNFIDSSITPSNFNSNNIYFYGLLHNNIKDLTNNNKIIGEIVIEHKNSNSQDDIVYVCFLVKLDMDQKSNNLDKFIHFINNNSKELEYNIDLNEVIPKQNKTINYIDKHKGKNNHIYIYDIPITVNEKSAEFFKNLSIQTDLFNVSAPLTPKYIEVNDREGFSNIEGFEDEIYIDCTPVGESDENIQTYNVPVEGEYTNQKVKIEFFKSAMYFMFFLMITVCSYLFIPATYKHTIIDKTNKSNYNKHETIRFADLVISLLYFVFTWSLIINVNIEKNPYIWPIVGFLTLFYGLFFALIQGKKTSKDFMTTKGDDAGSAGLYSDTINETLTFNIFSAITFAAGLYASLFPKMKGFIGALIVSYLIFYFSRYFLIDDKPNIGSIIGDFIWTGSFICLVIVPLIMSLKD